MAGRFNYRPRKGTEEGMEELQEPKHEEEYDVAVVTVSSLLLPKWSREGKKKTI